MTTYRRDVNMNEVPLHLRQSLKELSAECTIVSSVSSPCSWSNNPSLKKELLVQPRVHPGVMVMLSSITASCTLKALFESQLLFARSGFDKGFSRLDERGHLLNDDVEKYWKVASEAV
jgi:hypothetical protein